MKSIQTHRPLAKVSQLRGLRHSDRQWSLPQLLDSGDCFEDSERSQKAYPSARHASAQQNHTITGAVKSSLSTVKYSAIVILILVCALSVSLTLLMIQGHNFASTQLTISASSQEEPSSTRSADSHQQARSSGLKEQQQIQEDAQRQAQQQDQTQTQAQEEPQLQSQSQGNQLININTASSQQLQEIPGVGPSIAGRIIDYRASHGRFTTVDQLMNVSGIGTKTLEKLRSYVSVQ
ncbi:ComEA family DNA-binding protein [Alloscardovia venturai]|uniref:ComEA family DNA-binding protein n=1 Tax=Alloscardovia venturai TaxID=1769421 RepID=A0ABW2Y6E5_9BIFI